MTKPDLKKLRADAEKYRGKGRLDKAIEAYEEIEKNKGADAKTLQKMAEIYLKLDREDDGIETYRKAMKSYLETGFLVQAIAVGKILQELCPDDDELNQEVEKLLAKKVGTAAPAPAKIPAQKSAPAKQAQIPDQEKEQPPEERAGEEEEQETEVEAEPDAEKDAAGEERIELEDESAGPESVPEEPEEEEAGPEPETESIDYLLFKNLNPEEFSSVYKKLRSVKIPRGLKICREGEKGDSLFMLAQGEVEVTKKNERGEERLLARLGPGEFFGEFGYFMDGARHATVEAVTDLELLEISKPDLDQIISQYPQVKEVMYELFKQRVLDNLLVLSPLTSILPSEDRQKLIAKFELKELKSGEVIVREGDPGDSMFLIKSGQAEVTTIDPKDKRKLTLARLGPGDFFGEVSLIKNKPRTATITALSAMELLVISRRSFEELTREHPEMVSLLEQTIEKRVEDTIKKIIGDKP